MALLSQLLSMPELGLRLVQAGPGDPELSWASTTELLDLGEYLEGGEVVLTTGLALEHDDPRWRDFVAGLSRSRVAAIAFGVGVNHERIPAPLVAAASTYRVALVEVPPPVPFIAVSKAVAGLLRSDELRAAQRALQVHQRLLEGAHGPQDNADVLASIAQATGRQLALITGDGEKIASTAGFAASSSAGGSSAGGRAGLGDDEVIPLDQASGTRLVIAGGEPLEAEARAVIAAGAMVLGLGVRGERSEDERERGRWSRLTDGLLRGRIGPDAARVLEPDLALPDRVRAIAVQGAAEEVAAWRRTPRSSLGRLVTAAQDLGEANSLGRRSPGISLAWQLCADDEATLERVLAGIASHGLDAVVGRAADLADAELSRRSAVVRLGRLSTVSQLYVEPRTPAIVWADRGSPILEALIEGRTGGAQAPAGAGRREDQGSAGGSHAVDGAGAGLDLERLCRAVLGPLSTSRSGAAGGGAGGATPSEPAAVTEAEAETLRDTLRTLLTHNGQRGPAAASLGVHRNTLRDRMMRIERITGRSLDLPDDRAELWLALRLEETLD